MNFEVIRQTLRRTDSAPIIADSINYLTAKFRFSSDWADLEKHATFTLGANVYDKTLDDDDEIKANQSLNLTEGIWTVGVVGVEVVEGEMVERITADTVSILVTMAGALGGEAFPEISGAFGEAILQSEADRVVAEAARVAAEEDREVFYAAAQTGFDEEARVTAEGLRVEAESAREIAEGLRESFYQDAQTGFDEAARVSAENLRIEAESARSIAEGLRDSAEQGRDSDEGLRVIAEQGRDTAEGLRVTAESGRDIAEGLRASAEQGRDTAEGLRDSAEQSRDSAEGSRIAAESARAFYAAYSATTSYILGNKVSYNGSSYIWSGDDPSVAGTQPPSTGWLLIASRGDDGTDGTSGVYVGSDPIPEGYNIQIDPDGDATDVVLQFGTMPTADADYLGVTALYTGVTGTYKNGGTYICVSSGGATPVYSWSRVGEDVSGAISTHNTDAGAHATIRRIRGSVFSKMLQGTLKEGESSLIINIIGDSLSNDLTDWNGLLLNKLIAEYPSYNIEYYLYNDSTSKYGAVQQLNSAGDAKYIETYKAGYPYQILKADTAATSADFDLSIKVALNNWHNGVYRYLASRYGAAGERCWQLRLNSSNKLEFYWSVDGAETTVGAEINLSTAGYTDGQAYWLRVTLDVDDGAGHYVLKGYTSPDGYTWTVAQTITGGTTTVLYDHASYPVSINGIGTSTSANSYGKVYKFILRNGIDGEIANPQPIDAIRALVDDNYIGARVGGTPTIYVYNASVGGKATGSYTLAHIKKVVPVEASAVVLVCLSHNDSIYHGSTYLTQLDTMITSIKTRILQPCLCIVTQNRKISPASYIVPHAIRRQQQIAYASTHDMEVIDLCSEFDLDSRGIASLLNVDGVHPNAAGNAMMADAVWDYINIYGD